jgi:membrane fusion protein (multidrug efflux system)
MKKSTIFTGLIILILIIVVAWLLWPQSVPEQGQGMAGGYGAGGPVPVETMKVHQKAIEMTMELPARVVAYRQSEVRPQVTGIIEARLFEQGSLVEKGQKLYQLDDARYVANLKSSEADLQNARAQLKTVNTRANRIRSLKAQKAVSQQDLDDVEAQLAQAQAAIAVAQANVDLQKINIEYAQIKAPISGRIGQTFLTEGALVNSGQEQPLAVITQLSPVYVDMQVSADRAQQVMSVLSRQHQSQQTPQADTDEPNRLKVTVSQNSGSELTGFLEFSDVVVDETTGAITLRAVLENEAMNLLPGLFVTATLHLGTNEEILVPQRATSRNPLGGLDVWVVNADNSVVKKTIQSQQAYQDQWIISEGIKSGETIVMVGYQKLQPGAQVNPSPFQATQPNDLKGQPEDASKQQNNQE